MGAAIQLKNLQIEIPGVKIGRLLNEGSFSYVYLATLDSTGQEVIIKVSKDSIESQQIRRNFILEAFSLGSIKHHNVVDVLHYGESNNHCYLILEYVSGQSIRELVKGGALPFEKAMELFKQMCLGIQAIHRKNIIHRDLKPENIMLDANGDVKIIDLGLAEVQAEKPKEISGLVGSLLYAAPEQIGALKRPVDERSDLYGLGVILYEMLTGEKPFDHNEFNELYKWHTSGTYADYSKIDLLDGVVSAVLQKLLKKDPDDRLSSIDELLFLLGHVQKDDLDSILIGREKEVEILDEIWTNFQNKKSQRLIVSGNPGVGKSFLVRKYLESKSKNDFKIIYTKSESGIQAPLYALRQMVGQLINKFDGQSDLKSKINARYSIYDKKVLHGAFPNLSKFLELGVEEKEPYKTLPELFEIVEVVFDEIFAQSRVILYLDDLPWIDGETANFLPRLHKLSSDHGQLIIYTARNDETSQAYVDDFKEALKGHIETINVEKLSEDDSNRLVKAQLGNRPVQGDVTQLLNARADGNPFSLIVFIAAMKESEIVNFSWGKWTLNSDNINDLNLPNSVMDVIISRIESLPDETKRFLEVAAFDGTKFDLDRCMKAAGIHADRVPFIISDAIEAKLVEVDDSEKLAFVYDRVVETLTSKVSNEEAEKVHTLLANELIVGFESGDHQDIYSLSNHLLVAGPGIDAEVKGHWIEKAAEQALNEHLNREAKRYLLETSKIRETKNIPFDHKLYAMLAQVHFRDFELNEALDYAFKAVETCDDKLTRIRYRLLLLKTMMSHAMMSNPNFYKQVTETYNDLGKNPSGSILFLIGDSLVKALISFSGLKYLFKRRQERFRLLSILDTINAHAHFHGAKVDINKPLFYTFRSFFYAKFYGESIELAKASSQLSLLFATLKLEFVSDYFNNKAKKIAERCYDRTVGAECLLWEAIGQEFLGNHVHASNLAAKLHAEKGEFLHGMEYMNVCFVLVVTYFMRGHINSAQRYMKFAHDLFKKQGYTLLGVPIMVDGTISLLDLMQDNRSKEIAKDYLSYPTEHVEAATRDKFTLGHVLPEMVISRAFRGKTTVEEIEEWDGIFQREIGIPPTMSFFMPYSYIFVFNCYAYMFLWLEAKLNNLDPGDAPKRFKKHLFKLLIGTHFKLFKSHYLILKAYDCFLSGYTEKSRKWIQKALDFAREIENAWVQVECYRLLALIARSENNESEMKASASYGISVAQSFGLNIYSRMIRDEFFGQSTTSKSYSRTYDQSSSFSIAESQPHLIQQRQFEFLKQMSLVLADGLKSDHLRDFALKTIGETLGAERVLLLDRRESGEGYTAINRYSQDGNTENMEENISYTIVDTVFSSKKPIIYSGFDMDIGSNESIIANDIRSVIATPLTLGDKFFGVIYCDNTIVKGAFSEEDIDLLQAMGNQIAFSLAMVQSANVELSKKELERDMEVAGTVQSLFVPSQLEGDTDSVYFTIHYESASKSGGDWIWHNTVDNKMHFLIGDVSGHGVGAAMVTSIVAGTFYTHEEIKLVKGDSENIIDSSSPAQYKDGLEYMDTVLSRICNRAYSMTCAFLTFDFKQKSLEVTSSAAPPVVVVRGDEVHYLGSGGSLLGFAEYLRETDSINLQSGDRVIVFTDGVYEMSNPQGRDFGLRRFGRWALKHKGLHCDAFKKKLIEDLFEFRAGAPLDDDLTFAIFDIK
ncbi:MAG: protein kinase [Bdellovibrionales bacterium]